MASWVRHLLAFILITGLFGVVLWILPRHINLTNSTVSLFVGQVIGVFNGLAMVVVQHYFPRAQGSQNGKH